MYQDVQDLQQKNMPTKLKIQQFIKLYTWGTFFLCVHQTHLACLLPKSYFFYLFFSRVPVVSDILSDILTHCALRQYRHTSSSWQIRNIFS